MIVAGVIYLCQHGDEAVALLRRWSKPKQQQPTARPVAAVKQQLAKVVEVVAAPSVAAVETAVADGGVHLGQWLDTQKHLAMDWHRLKSIALWGMSGSGKTTFHYNLIYETTRRYSSEQLKTVFFDFKGGVSFSVFAKLGHNMLPFVQTVPDAGAALSLLQREMGKRSEMMKAATDRHVHIVDDVATYNKLEEVPLPIIVVFIDEVQDLTNEAATLAQLMDIAKKGRSFGVYLVTATQYPTAIPPELRGQMTTLICGKLRNERSYSDAAGILKEHWGEVIMKPGMFFFSNDDDWRIIRGPQHDKGLLARYALENSSSQQIEWPETVKRNAPDKPKNGRPPATLSIAELELYQESFSTSYAKENYGILRTKHERYKELFARLTPENCVDELLGAGFTQFEAEMFCQKVVSKKPKNGETGGQ